MDDWKDFWADYKRCWELDPVQHMISVLVGLTAMALVWVFWASVRGLV